MIRRLLLPAVAVIIGLGIALVDSSPGFDDTGVTAGGLFLTSAVIAFLGRDRPWLWALLVGIWTPLLEVPRTGDAASIAGLAFAAAGSTVGWLARRELAPAAR